MKPFLPTLLALALPLVGQGLPDRFRENHAAWEESLDKGQGVTVRKATEELLRQEAGTVNPSDYNAMHAMVAVQNLAARACVLEGAWEDAILHLEKASQAASDNAATADGTFSKLVAEHQEKLKQWREETAQQEKRLQNLDDQPGLTSDQIKLRGQIKGFLDEHRRAIAQSEKSLREIDALLTLLKKEQDTYTTALAEWKNFLAKERADIARLGTVTAYVTEKLEQVRADDARPRNERLAYGRRLLRLDPTNRDCQRFVDGLEGRLVPAAAQNPTPPKKTKHRKRTASSTN
jgi:small-conductance mechanosensitive channel